MPSLFGLPTFAGHSIAPYDLRSDSELRLPNAKRVLEDLLRELRPGGPHHAHAILAAEAAQRAWVLSGRPKRSRRNALVQTLVYGLTSHVVAWRGGIRSRFDCANACWATLVSHDPIFLGLEAASIGIALEVWARPQRGPGRPPAKARPKASRVDVLRDLLHEVGHDLTSDSIAREMKRLR